MTEVSRSGAKVQQFSLVNKCFALKSKDEGNKAQARENIYPRHVEECDYMLGINALGTSF